MAKEITDANFQELLAEGKPLVVDFWAPWCGPCRALSPVIEEKAKEYEGRIIVGKADVSECDDICSEYAIMSIPAILFFKDGKLVNRYSGTPGSQEDWQKFNNLFEEHL